MEESNVQPVNSPVTVGFCRMMRFEFHSGRLKIMSSKPTSAFELISLTFIMATRETCLMDVVLQHARVKAASDPFFPAAWPSSTPPVGLLGCGHSESWRDCKLTLTLFVPCCSSTQLPLWLRSPSDVVQGTPTILLSAFVFHIS